MSNRYIVQPRNKHARGMHRYMVVDTVHHRAVFFTVTREDAQTEADMRNATETAKWNRKLRMPSYR